MKSDTGSELTDAFDRRAGMIGVLLCALVLAYFAMLSERFIFDFRYFTPIFFDLLYFSDQVAAAAGVLVCMAALLVREPRPFLRLVDFIDRHIGAVSVGSSVVFGVGALVAYRNYPLSMDEYAAVFQSKIFASGHLVAHLPPSLVPWLVVPGFNGFFLFVSPETGHAIEAYWPGFALLLAPFQLVGIPWFCNAALAGLSVYLIHRITLDVTGDRRTAGWAILFALASSAYWANAISYYSMQAHLTANLLYAWLLLKPSNIRCLAAGLTGSLALILHNPVPHALFALPWLLAIAVDRSAWRWLLPLTAGYIPGIVVGVAWAWLKGDILPATGSAAAMGDALGKIFVLPNSAIFNMRVAAAVKMWIWALPCLFYFAVLGFLRMRRNRHIRLLSLSAALTFLGYLFVPLDQGHGWGYRYFHSAWGVVPILAACATIRRKEDQQGLLSFAGASAVLSLVVLVPFQLWQIHHFIGRHLAMVPEARRPGGNVFFVDPEAGHYLGDMIQLDPGLRSRDLVLMSRGRELDTELMRQNWPDAVRCGGAAGVDQWCAGAARPSVTDNGHFMPGFTDAKPSSEAFKHK